MIFKAMKLTVGEKRGADIVGLICGAFQQLKFEERSLKIGHSSRRKNNRECFFEGIQVKTVF